MQRLRPCPAFTNDPTRVSDAFPPCRVVGRGGPSLRVLTYLRRTVEATRDETPCLTGEER